MDPINALLSVRDLLEPYPKAYSSYYLEFQRRLYVLKLVDEYCQRDSTILDLGAQPFIMSCALRKMGYKVIAYDYDPEPYMEIAKLCGVEVMRRDLERDSLDIYGTADCIVFSEVLEHLNPYYVGHILTEMNKALKYGGKLILTTPNIASLFRRLKLLLGLQPQQQVHVHEYTKKEVEDLLQRHGFCIIRSYYSDINDLSFIDGDENDYLKVNKFVNLIRVTMKRPTKVNILRTLAYPIIKAVPNLRILIVVIAEKCKETTPTTLERW